MSLFRRLAVGALLVALLSPPVFPAAADPRCACGAREGSCCCLLMKAAGLACAIDGASCGMTRPSGGDREAGLASTAGLRPVVATAVTGSAPPDVPAWRTAEATGPAPTAPDHAPDPPPPRVAVG